MRVPPWMLKHTVEVEPFVGEGAYGPVYGSPFTARALVTLKTGRILDRNGTEVVYDAVALFGPDTEVTIQSRVVWEGRKFTVIGLKKPVGMTGKPHHIEVVLR